MGLQWDQGGRADERLLPLGPGLGLRVRLELGLELGLGAREAQQREQAAKYRAPRTTLQSRT